MHTPRLPGVGVAGVSREETVQLVKEAIALHLDALAEDGLPIPLPDVADVGQVEPALPR
ncbi:MAG: type II toxin-antitoxin system HicB family antitoxin [Acidimicrobiales bacterium]